jgi:hypothetical protein
MYVFRRAALPALISLALVGCAHVPPTQRMTQDVAAAVQPVDVKVGIKQPELYAEFEHSAAGQAAAAGCGAIPGIGVLLAAACGGVAGAVDAKVNAERAKAADEIVRPLKDAIVDVKFDEMMSGALAKSLGGVPGMKIAVLNTTKTVEDKAYEETFRASTSNGVMFVNIDYHVSRDFSTLDISARSLIYPRSVTARTAAGLPAELPTGEPLLAIKNSAYRTSAFYHLKLPVQAATPAEYVDAWKAENARMLRLGLDKGTAEVSRLLAEDLQRVPGAKEEPMAKVDAAPGIKADLVSERDGGKVLRYPDGSMHFHASAPMTATTASATAGAAPGAGSTAR